MRRLLMAMLAAIALSGCVSLTACVTIDHPQDDPSRDECTHGGRAAPDHCTDRSAPHS